jgi:Mrp family chromosome partitioning ATPase
MRHHYDFIVVDTRPVIPVPDCRVLENRVDGFLMVVSADKTPRKLLQDALTELAPEKVLGIVFNRYQHPSTYYLSWYSSYYSGAAGRSVGEEGEGAGIASA